MGRKIRRYETQGMVVEFEAARCIHAAECVHGLPEVFDAKARPWIQPANATPDSIAAVVHQCPTGALRYRCVEGGPVEAPAAENTVRVIPDGPLYVAGRLRLHLPDGEVREETRVALCRCGESKNKPYCDNAHAEKGFTDPGVAVEHRLGPTSDDGDVELAVRLAPDGPILLQGPLRAVAADASSSEGGKAALCRCGASGSKPYCDGAHVAAGFVAD